VLDAIAAHTGDEASMDTDGYFRITGAHQDLIIRAARTSRRRRSKIGLREHPARRRLGVYAGSDAFCRGSPSRRGNRLKPEGHGPLKAGLYVRSCCESLEVPRVRRAKGRRPGGADRLVCERPREVKMPC